MAEELVLVVDDEEKVRNILTHILKSAGYHASTAGDPKRALTVAREISPDVVLLDVTMPLMDGFEVCRKLQEHPETKKIPVVFLTARGDDLSRRSGRASGGVLYLTKPFTRETVLSAVRVALASRHNERSGSG